MLLNLKKFALVELERLDVLAPPARRQNITFSMNPIQYHAVTGTTSSDINYLKPYSRSIVDDSFSLAGLDQFQRGRFFQFV
jgi:hypothetical protein